MASIEFIQKRIEGKEKEIEKLTKKIERIEKAEATNWEVNPYWYTERDKISAERELTAALNALKDYQSQLQVENDKAASRNIPAILEFLAKWKERMICYYEASFNQYLEALNEWREYSHNHSEWYNSEGYATRRNDPDLYKKIENEYRDKQAQFHSTWAFISEYTESKYDGEKYTTVFNKEKFQKVLDREADMKYDFIIDRTLKIVKIITDASGLSIGAKGDLNGIIIGTEGKAKVTTIGAGGYNIQCFHFRTLVDPVK